MLINSYDIPVYSAIISRTNTHQLKKLWTAKSYRRSPLTDKFAYLTCSFFPWIHLTLNLAFGATMRPNRAVARSDYPHRRSSRMRWSKGGNSMRQRRGARQRCDEGCGLKVCCSSVPRRERTSTRGYLIRVRTAQNDHF